MYCQEEEGQEEEEEDEVLVVKSRQSGTQTFQNFDDILVWF